MKFMSIPIVLIVVFFSANIFAEEITVVTEYWPPYNYEKDGVITGLSTEIVRATLERAKVKGNFGVYPWGRAYDMALNDKNVLIYTITRNEKREKLFQWIGPIASRELYLWKLKKRTDIVINDIEEAKKYVVGSEINDAATQMLIDYGFKEDVNLEIVPTNENNYRKLFEGRVDLFNGVRSSVVFQFRKHNLPFDQIETAFLLVKANTYYMAFGKKTSPDLVARIQKAFEAISKEKKVEAITNKYLR
ncbi:MAG: amino acid ABC transporter substrate-binding protein [bacterium]|nr:amino acid ABC transporter substrate-binding protein [bacterium]